MTVDERLQAVLGALAGGRVYPDVAPPDAQAPYIVFQQVGGQGFGYTEGTVPAEENCRIQLATWCATRIEATTLAQQAEALLLQATTCQATTLGTRTSLLDDDTGLRGARQDFSVWVPRT